MKRRDLIKKLTDAGWWLLRHGGNHDIYTNGGQVEPVSHKREIPEETAKAILRRAGLK